MTVKMKVEGFRDLEKALADLPRGTSRGVARRAMKKELQPVADMANELWPGTERDVFRITSRISRRQLGASRMQRGPNILNLFVGAPGGKDGTPEAHLVEFGTGPRYHKSGKYVGQVSPQPALQPAWDANKNQILNGLGKRLWAEIEKTVARRARRAAKAANK